MEARAVRKYIRSSPRKMRRVVNVVRGLPVTEALNTLHFLPQQATDPVAHTIKSAIHNLMDLNPTERFDEEDLWIKEIKVDEGPMLKRHRPVSRGRAHPIRKRMSHLTVIVQAQQA
ncbi:MAG: 50S ribosomal protein L22 [Bacteroidetes bacterium]|nr:50S ribosomal protein L22 [Bacteroidota bacterium]